MMEMDYARRLFCSRMMRCSRFVNDMMEMDYTRLFYRKMMCSRFENDLMEMDYTRRLFCSRMKTV